jgi:Fe-S-cluster-containing hydrogenase component 2
LSVKRTEALPSRRSVEARSTAARSVGVKCRFDCGACSAACPSGAIRETAAGVSIDRSVCSKCKICIRLCPAGLIGDEEVG